MQSTNRSFRIIGCVLQYRWSRGAPNLTPGPGLLDLRLAAAPSGSVDALPDDALLDLLLDLIIFGKLTGRTSSS